MTRIVEGGEDFHVINGDFAKFRQKFPKVMQLLLGSDNPSWSYKWTQMNGCLCLRWPAVIWMCIDWLCQGFFLFILYQYT